MRVVHLSWEYPPVVYGGLGRHVHALAEAQARRGDQVVVITQSHPTAPADEVVNGVRIIRVEHDAPILADWRDRFIEWCFGLNVAMARAAIALTRQWRPDVVHGHDWLVGQASVLAAESGDLPFVLTVHATESGRTHGLLVTDQSRAIDSIEEWSVERADAVIVCSQYMRDEVIELFAPDAVGVTVVPNGIDPDDWVTTPACRRAMRRRYGAPLVACVGRLEVEKGVQTLIEAMAAVRKAVPGARAVVIGTGGAEADLTRLVRRRRLTDAVTFAGFVSDADLRATVAAADAAVVPSLYEPFGFVALEAMALGAPLIASCTGGLAEIVDEGRTGWLVPPGDAPALAGALIEVLSQPRRARSRAAEARAGLPERFGWAAIARRTDEVYRTVAGRRPARARSRAVD